MGTVAVIALHQAFIDSMVKRPRELSPYVLVAAVTEPRRLCRQEKFALLGMVRRMTLDATYTVCEVLRPVEIAVLRVSLMAAHAALADLGR
jgi:hypothetical protein